ncbi:MAG: sugar ABC transporter substrate-binding protein [Butyricicoccus sp.]|nr:sugar ABC transporter substrate-binding protein [Butyricicoccus sp.]
MKKRILAMLMAGAMVVSLAACSGSSDDAASSAAGSAPASSAAASAAGDEAYNISVILKTTSAEYWQYVVAGCEAYAEEHGVQVEVKGPPSETSYDEQMNMIETDLSNPEFDAIVIAPLQGETVATLIEDATVPILAVDTDIDSPIIKTFVGTGNEAAAKLGGIAAVEAAKAAGWEEIKCIEIAGVQGDATNTARMNGYMAGVEEAGGDFLENEVQYANAVADQAVTCMEAIMQTHPEGVAIICANNDDMAMAAARAAEGNAAFENTIFMGFNGDRTACEAILKGELTLSVAQDAYGMGYKAVEAACQILDGETLDRFVDSGAEIVNPDNAQARLDALLSYLGK